MTIILRPYQKAVFQPVFNSVAEHQGLTFTVEMARQAGKNELSAQLELYLLMNHANDSCNLIKCSPTFKPQTIISMNRLKEKLNEKGFTNKWLSEMGYIIRLGECRAIFLSADESANVVGNTAHLLLEVDEAQDVSEEKYTKEFKPMGSTTNATNVLYGTTWDDSTLLEKMKQINLELEKKDGVQRHFRYDWQEIAKYNPYYRMYVEGEKQRLGENHPLFLTQYRLLPVHEGGGFLNTLQKVQLQGEHCRQHKPEPGKTYIAGVDLAGEEENDERDILKDNQPRRDSTVVTIGELSYDSSLKISEPPSPDLDSMPFNPFIRHRVPSIKIVEHYVWTGKKHPALYSQLIEIIRNIWHLKSLVVDATGIGQPVASFLQNTLGARIIPFTFTPASKTELGFNLLAAINSGGLKMYAADNSPEYKEFWFQMEKAKGFYRPSQTMNFYVDPSEGHDDYLMSLALLVEAAQRYEPRKAVGR